MESSDSHFQTFTDGQGRPVSDLVGFVKEWLKSHPRGEIYVGADSKVRSDKVKYSTVVCLWDVGRGVTEKDGGEVRHGHEAHEGAKSGVPQRGRLHVCVCVCLFVCLFICLFVCLFVCACVRAFIKGG